MNFDSIKRPALFADVYKSYITDRGITDIDENLFERIALIYPGLLATSSDGFVDLTEANYLIKSANISSGLDIIAREFKFLYLNSGAWRTIFSKLIIEYTKINDLTKDILQLMLQAACSSTGSVVKNIMMAGQNPTITIELDFNKEATTLDPEKQFLSEQERKTILDVAEKLGFLQDTKVSSYLQKLLA